MRPPVGTGKSPSVKASCGFTHCPLGQLQLNGQSKKGATTSCATDIGRDTFVSSLSTGAEPIRWISIRWKFISAAGWSGGVGRHRVGKFRKISQLFRKIWNCRQRRRKERGGRSARRSEHFVPFGKKSEFLWTHRMEQGGRSGTEVSGEIAYLGSRGWPIRSQPRFERGPKPKLQRESGGLPHVEPSANYHSVLRRFIVYS